MISLGEAPEIFKVGSQAYCLETYDNHYPTEVLNFFLDNWVKRFPDLFPNFIPPIRFLTHKRVSALKDDKGAVIALHIGDGSWEGDEGGKYYDVGTIIVDKNSQKAGIAEALMLRELEKLKPDEQPEATAQTMEGLKFLLRLQQTIRDKVNIEISTTKEVDRELVAEVVEAFASELDEACFSTLWDLCYEKKLNFSDDLMSDIEAEFGTTDWKAMDLEAVVFWALRKADITIEEMVELSECQDTERVREKLRSIGIIISSKDSSSGVQ